MVTRAFNRQTLIKHQQIEKDFNRMTAQQEIIVAISVAPLTLRLS